VVIDIVYIVKYCSVEALLILTFPIWSKSTAFRIMRENRSELISFYPFSDYWIVPEGSVNTL